MEQTRVADSKWSKRPARVSAHFALIAFGRTSTGGASVRPLGLVETRNGCECGRLCWTPVRSGPSGVASEINVPVSLGRELISRSSIETASYALLLSGARRCKNGTHCASSRFAALLRRNGQIQLYQSVVANVVGSGNGATPGLHDCCGVHATALYLLLSAAFRVLRFRVSSPRPLW